MQSSNWKSGTAALFCLSVLMAGSAFASDGRSNAIGTVQQVYDGWLTPDVQANTFRNIDRLFPTRTVNRGGPAIPLETSSKPITDVKFQSNGKTVDLFDYLSLNRVAGLLILKDGKVAYEDYELGNSEATRWMSMSVAKSISSTLVGAAIKDGFIKSIDDPVTQYLPELAGGAYEGVSVRNLLQMASGAKWDETYTDPNSDRRHMLERQLEGKPGTIVAMMARLPRAHEPGAAWNYSTGETHLVGALVRAAVGRPVSVYLSEKIWSKLGMEQDATWWVESPNGLEVGGSGFSATLRDYARFGQFVLNKGVIDGESVVPEGWFDQAGSPKELSGKTVNYGFMWWPLAAPAGTPNESAFTARGIFGQYVYVNPKEHVVIAMWSARSKPTGAPPIVDVDFFAAAVSALR
ncbi:serine hydrolase [Methylobacterium sp. WL30]|uniref:serine hydrolase domain-containing protein n=1 Tax=Methylobacterium sp. WL93 TaxID=2603892 RepID=UPI0011C8D0F5|nr:serine hydrolase [Methylobacterium sp. WL93]TXN40553.1 serine hydrolase [Methylobacterium sp. WL93]TXN49638.1 serine hydrolase [Methylobacterium sp. WL119]TXN62914.1 serine hydrolase [Methylobacterium sp. WL30]